ncbi:hypothetical protein [Faecalibacillus intestinalis]|jgi:hypothetical protein|uniref:hypothetical protein n=1 Tax=Faecalibacillus intestinalis TaxID=1982626 RepID=UPI00399235FC
MNKNFNERSIPGDMEEVQQQAKVLEEKIVNIESNFNKDVSYIHKRIDKIQFNIIKKMQENIDNLNKQTTSMMVVISLSMIMNIILCFIIIQGGIK